MKPEGLPEMMGEDASNSFSPKKKQKTGPICQDEPSQGTGNQPKIDHKLESIQCWKNDGASREKNVHLWFSCQDCSSPHHTAWPRRALVLPVHGGCPTISFGPRRGGLNLGQEVKSHGSPAKGGLVGNEQGDTPATVAQGWGPTWYKWQPRQDFNAECDFCHLD